MKLKKYIKKSNQLIDMPYNQLNINNYFNKIKKIFPLNKLELTISNINQPISLMSGHNRHAGIIFKTASKNIREEPNIYIIGKGILFDSGGYSLKNNMKGMHTDMAGMAIATAVTEYCSIELGYKNVYSICPISTNFIHNSKIIVGDKIKIGKKIVQVDNTDAEGRLILAEALSTFRHLFKKNDIVITIATLTGACAYAVGTQATAILSPNKKLAKRYLKASRKTGELAAELPLWEYLQKAFNKKLMSNIHKDKCGTITAAMFLKQFVKYPANWIHLDIASSATKDDKATGQPIQTLIQFIEKITKKRD